jgi:multidrug resistance efflux pump
MSVHFDAFNNKFELTLKGQSSYKVDVGTDGLGNITRINNALEAIPAHLGKAEERLETLHQQVETAKAEMEKPFAQIDDLKEMEARLSELNALLNMDSGSDRSDAEARDDEPEERISADKPAARESVMDRLKKMQSKVKPSVEGTEHPSKHKQQEI